jgi:hypothetical protein
MYVSARVQAAFFISLISITAGAQTVRTAQTPVSGAQGTFIITCDPDTGCPSPTPRPTPIPTPTPAPPDLTFDANAYENIYPDIKNVYGTNLAGATSHYQLFGLPAGRRGGVIFDPVFYLQNNPDLLAAFGATGYQAAANHFINTGLPVEGRQGSQEFDVKYYLANNSDLAAAFGSTGYIAAAKHFLSQGWPNEGRQGSATVDVKAYINNYPEIQASYGLFSDRYTNAMFHWLRRGKGFGRVSTGSPVTTSTDCTSAAPPVIPGTNTPYTRVFIGLTGHDGSGSSASDPRDGTQFDAILRSFSGDPAAGIAPVSHLVICILNGNYLTDGSYNWVINIPHNSEVTQNRGFAIGPNWHIHGNGTTQTTVTLNSYYTAPPGGEPASAFVANGSNVVFSTSSDNTPGVEISDLTIDDNYPGLKLLNNSMPLSLQAIHLRDNNGGHYIHRVNVINVGNDAPFGEAFPVSVSSVAYNLDPTKKSHPATPPSQFNTIEFVTMSQYHGGPCTAMTMVYATGAMQFNVVNGYQIAYGGWEMPFVAGTAPAANQFAYIHDNFALNGQYGMNIDSEFNDFVNIQFNTIVNPTSYGIVIGSSSAGVTRFDNFAFLYNEIDMNVPGSTGLVMQGNVTNTVLTRTNVIGKTNVGTALNVTNTGNFSNVFQFNQLFNLFPVTFNNGSSQSQNCVYGNWDQGGNQRSDFPNNTSTPCRPGL